MKILKLISVLVLINLISACKHITPRADNLSLKVMTYNIHRGGIVHLKQPLSQTGKVIKLAVADIVGIQEPRSPEGFTTKKLAKLMGWNHSANIRKGIILTPHEIIENLEDGVKIKLPSGQEVYAFSLHLPSHPFQPYQLLGIRPKWHKHTNDIEFIKTEKEAIQWAKKARGAEIQKLLKTISSLPDKDAPVFVVGDFNEPSHLDWTEAAAKAGRHPIKVAYPNSLSMINAGFKDSYRVIYPDEMKNPGLTWSTKYEEDDPTTHHDRIDFIYFRGRNLHLKDVKIVGESPQKADIVISPYPSDHRALVSTFNLNSNQN